MDRFMAGRLTEHLPGKHDQKSHGKGGGGAVGGTRATGDAASLGMGRSIKALRALPLGRLRSMQTRTERAISMGGRGVPILALQRHLNVLGGAVMKRAFPRG